MPSLLPPPQPPKSLNLWIIDGKIGNATLRFVKVLETGVTLFQVGVVGEEPKSFNSARAARKHWKLLIEYHLLLALERTL